DSKERAQQLLSRSSVEAEAQQPSMNVDLEAITAALLDDLQVADDSALTRHASSRDEALIEPLSERELEVLKLIAEGFANREIADQLFLSVGTVKWYTSHIFSKLGVQNRTLAILRARQLKLIQ